MCTTTYRGQLLGSCCTPAALPTLTISINGTLTDKASPYVVNGRVCHAWQNEIGDGDLVTVPNGVQNKICLHNAAQQVQSQQVQAQRSCFDSCQLRCGTAGKQRTGQQHPASLVLTPRQGFRVQVTLNHNPQDAHLNVVPHIHLQTAMHTASQRSQEGKCFYFVEQDATYKLLYVALQNGP